MQRSRTKRPASRPRLMLCSVALVALTHVLLPRTDACLDDFLTNRHRLAFQNTVVTNRSRGTTRGPRIRETTTRTIRSAKDDDSIVLLPNESRCIPRHVAFICDGNSRWAEARFLPASAGHAAGADRLVDCLDALKRRGVQYCTMYGFSTENWRRPQHEIRDILTIMEQTAKNFHSRAIREKVHVRILGDLEDERIPSSLRDTLKRLERDTAAAEIQRAPIDDGTNMVDGNLPSDSTKLTLCIAVNYGGRQDILNASRKIAEAVSREELNANDLSDDDFASLLCTSQVPDPDFIIRTGGEQRLSNFLLWNAAYAELYFTDTLWPDFDDASLEEALNWYTKRTRRFGGRQQANAAVILNGKSR